jgi:hypothetical protein
MSFFKKIFGNKSASEPKQVQNNTTSTSNDIYKESVNIFIENYDNPDSILNNIFQLTKSEENTELIYLFIPHFFCRLFIPEVEYTDYYILENSDKSKTEIKFKDSKILDELFNSIKINWNEYLKKDFMKILFHSGDFRAINEMLHKGADIKNMQALPPTIPYKPEDDTNELENDTQKILALMFKKASSKINYSEFQKHFIFDGKDTSEAIFNIMFTHFVLEIPREQTTDNIKGKMNQIGVNYSKEFIDRSIIGNKNIELESEIKLYRIVLQMQNDGIEIEKIIEMINAF